MSGVVSESVSCRYQNCECRNDRVLKIKLKSVSSKTPPSKHLAPENRFLQACFGVVRFLFLKKIHPSPLPQTITIKRHVRLYCHFNDSLVCELHILNKTFLLIMTLNFIAVKIASMTAASTHIPQNLLCTCYLNKEMIIFSIF